MFFVGRKDPRSHTQHSTILLQPGDVVLGEECFLDKPKIEAEHLCCAPLLRGLSREELEDFRTPEHAESASHYVLFTCCRAAHRARAASNQPPSLAMVQILSHAVEAPGLLDSDARGGASPRTIPGLPLDVVDMDDLPRAEHVQVVPLVRGVLGYERLGLRFPGLRTLRRRLRCPVVPVLGGPTRLEPFLQLRLVGADLFSAKDGRQVRLRRRRGEEGGGLGACSCWERSLSFAGWQPRKRIENSFE